MKHFLRSLLLLAAPALLLTACHTSRNAVKDTTTVAAGTATTKKDNAAAATAAFVSRVKSNAQTAQAVTAHVKMSFTGLGKDMSVSGTLRMKRDDVIQLSLTLLGFEIGRMEFSPNDVLLIDRYNKRYVRAKYSDVSFIAKAGLDFKSLQHLFWGELFAPGTAEAKLDEAFTMSAAGGHTLLTVKDAPALNYEFLAATKTALLDRLTVQGRSTAQKGTFEWRYADYTTVGGRPFPGSMACNITGLGKDGGFTIALSRLDNATDWEGHTTPSAKYKQCKPEEILGMLF